MTIVPKIAENDLNNLNNIRPYILDKIEIQMLSDDLNEGFKNSTEIIDKLDCLKYVVLHLPFSCVNICYIHSNYKLESTFINFVVEVMKYSLKKNIEIDILFHLDMRYKYFKGMEGLSFLKYIIGLVEGTQVGFLLENSIINLGMSTNELINVVALSKEFNNEKLKFCFDICHWQGSENVMKGEISLISEYIDCVKNIHFSMTKDNDGYIDKENTHGVGHDSLESCILDLKYLENKGIDLEKVNIVTEINEIDYKNRPDMCKEINYLKEIENKGCVK